MKIFKRIVLGLLVLILGVLGTVYAASEWRMNRSFEAEPRTIQILTDSASVAEGERMALVLGCYRGCHGRDMEGVSDLFALPDGSVIRSSNLTQLVREYTAEQLEAAIRQGIRPDGKSVDAMPSASFAMLSDQHLGQILGFIAGYPEQDKEPGTSRLGPVARFFMLSGEFKMGVDAMVPGWKPVKHETLSDPDVLGLYLAAVACTECHGMDLGGNGEFTPNLMVARAYSLEQFTRLMREGVGVGDRDLGLMGQVAERRFSNFTDEEISALYNWLSTTNLPLAEAAAN